MCEFANTNICGLMHNKILSRRNFQSLALVPAATCRLWLQSIALLLGLLAAGAARGQNCEFYPIAVPAATLNNAAPGTILTNLFNGTQPGNFGWLTWAGSPSELTLVRSLTPPSDSAAYVNPDNPNDHQLNVGDWVQGKPAVSNARTVQAALDQLEQLEIIVPVWNQTRGQGENAAYRLSAFARIQLLGYQLPGQNRITARFLGYATCDAQNLPPTVDAGPDQTITLPSTAPLNGTAIDD